MQQDNSRGRGIRLQSHATEILARLQVGLTDIKVDSITLVPQEFPEGSLSLSKEETMASSSEYLGLQFHGRSISLPSRLHPSVIRIEAQLNKLTTSEASVTECLSGETIQDGLLGLAELYDCAQELIESPSTQQALLQYQHGKVVEEALEMSVEVLDSCGMVRDLFLMMKEKVQVLQSALRRKSGDSSIDSDITAYLCFRKKVKKEISKSLRALKHMESRVGSFFLLDVDHNLSMVIRLLREVTAITISILRSLLVFLSSPPSRTKTSGWSLISRLMLTKSAAPKGGHILSDVGCVDIALSSLHGHIRNDEAKAEIQMARERLEMLDNSIEGLEAGVEYLFRQLVRNRVTLLDILTC